MMGDAGMVPMRINGLYFMVEAVLAEAIVTRAEGYRADIKALQDVNIVLREENARRDVENRALWVQCGRERKSASVAEARWASALPFLKAFVADGYAEWDGYEFECPHCSLGHRAFNREQEWLSDPTRHDEDCLWRMAVEFLAANTQGTQNS